MKITYYGHSCFLVEQDQYRIVFDPFTGVPGYQELKVAANEVICSHEHGDHAYREAVTILPKRESPFTVEQIHSWHDDQHGALRGRNDITMISADNIKVAHFGDIGCELSAEEKERLKCFDVLMVPIGGKYTIDSKKAKQLMDELQPRYIFPMHYRKGEKGLSVVETIDPFLSYYKGSEIIVEFLPSTIEISNSSMSKKGTEKIIVMESEQ